ncbi:uncharacterized protein PSFLO_06307 [Pseudozyma flocculosa]|uniref:Uncharacterized protein n=1 Tax=Pseudozyma flocculosa TaxID=84751 RepID=A0A5C3FAX0_9BASI|nr:uncharacterized protein PSFLO_06307 [Pseudozyma flocculosa]
MIAIGCPAVGGPGRPSGGKPDRKSTDRPPVRPPDSNHSLARTLANFDSGGRSPWPRLQPGLACLFWEEGERARTLAARPQRQPKKNNQPPASEQKKSFANTGQRGLLAAGTRSSASAQADASATAQLEGMPLAATAVAVAVTCEG